MFPYLNQLLCDEDGMQFCHRPIPRARHSGVSTTRTAEERGRDTAPRRETQVLLCFGRVLYIWLVLPSTTNQSPRACHTECHSGLCTSWLVFWGERNSCEAAYTSLDPATQFSHLFPVRHQPFKVLRTLAPHWKQTISNKCSWHCLVIDQALEIPSIYTELGFTSAPPFCTVKVALLKRREGLFVFSNIPFL